MTDRHHTTGSGKPRARAIGVPFDGAPGANNAITDVAGVEVGYATIIEGDGPLVVGHKLGSDGRLGTRLDRCFRLQGSDRHNRTFLFFLFCRGLGRLFGQFLGLHLVSISLGTLIVDQLRDGGPRE